VKWCAEQRVAELRQRLADTYLEYAEQAWRRHDWAAANAFQTAAGLALGTTVALGHVVGNSRVRVSKDPVSRAAVDRGDGTPRIP
jgi:hypothetical protein